MKKLIALLASVAVPGFFSMVSPAAPQPASPPYHLTTVSWVVETRDNLSVDDHYVTLIGRVTRKIDDQEYWFTDGTASVRLDSGNFDLPIGRKIVLGGRIDQAYLGFGHLEVDVSHWHLAH